MKCSVTYSRWCPDCAIKFLSRWGSIFNVFLRVDIRVYFIAHLAYFMEAFKSYCTRNQFNIEISVDYMFINVTNSFRMG